jgi:hypothetical protein
MGSKQVLSIIAFLLKVYLNWAEVIFVYLLKYSHLLRQILVNGVRIEKLLLSVLFALTTTSLFTQ